MPTGYTEQLDKNEMDTKTWIMEGISRAFGICVMLRDAKSDLTEKEIIKHLKKDADDSWHIKSLAEAKAKLEKYNAISDADLEAEIKKENNCIKRENKKNIAGAAKRKKLHDTTRENLNKILQSKTIGETTRNIVEFGISQLDLAKNECEPYLSDLITDIKLYRSQKSPRLLAT